MLTVKHALYVVSYCQDVDGLVEEVQEARRIRLLHQPSKVYIGFFFLENFAADYSFYENVITISGYGHGI